MTENDDVVAYEHEVRLTVNGGSGWHTTLSHVHPDDALEDTETLEYRNVRPLVYADSETIGDDYVE